MDKLYQTDLTDNQWQYIQKILLFEERKRKHDLKEIWNGLLYLVKMGCQLRMLSKEYLKLKLVYYYFRKWSFYEQFDLLLSHLRGTIRLKRSQNKEASIGIMDFKSVKWEIIKRPIILMAIKKSKVSNLMFLWTRMAF